ncbi:hypothetical protein KR018_002436 [Drosophila ironensis]|nr:hypothetical protein KR018_002436 [Drosophila ironensis]
MKSLPRLWCLFTIVLIASPSIQGVDFVDGDPVLELSLGKVRGTTMTSFKGKTFYAFRGIRYAKAPEGDLRFSDPVPETGWGNEVLNATLDSLICPQPGVSSMMSEDCLKLNVYTYRFLDNLPVIVFIHGGANVLGSGHSSDTAGPQYLLDQDVVLVTFNYRLGALGFLTTNSPDTKGNFGYLDQVLALKWVQDHIANFGGDPEKVTLMGMSAGSMAVSLHLASPLSVGLFHRGILMSGSATNTYDIDNLYWSRKLSHELGCPMYDSKDVVACLRNVSWIQIVDTCKAWETHKFTNMKWNYEIDGHFMPRHPTEIIKEGNFSRVPLLVTYTANELDYSAYVHKDNAHLLHDLGANFVEYAPELFLYKQNYTTSERLKEFYLGSNVSEINADNTEKFGKVFSDAIIGHGVHRLVQLARHFTPVYYMRTDYIGERSYSVPQNEDGRPIGVGHADDLQYLMPTLWYGFILAAGDEDQFMMERLTSWFVNFAESGTPLITNGTWPPCNATDVTMLYNGWGYRVDEPDYAYEERYAVWDELFPTGGGAATWRIASLPMAIAAGVAWQLIGKLM